MAYFWPTHDKKHMTNKQKHKHKHKQEKTQRHPSKNTNTQKNKGSDTEAFKKNIVLYVCHKKKNGLQKTNLGDAT